MLLGIAECGCSWPNIPRFWRKWWQIKNLPNKTFDWVIWPLLNANLLCYFIPCRRFPGRSAVKLLSYLFLGRRKVQELVGQRARYAALAAWSLFCISLGTFAGCSPQPGTRVLHSPAISHHNRNKETINQASETLWKIYYILANMLWTKLKNAKTLQELRIPSHVTLEGSQWMLLGRRVTSYQLGHEGKGTP